jgi:hypothetical protein
VADTTYLGRLLNRSAHSPGLDERNGFAASGLAEKALAGPDRDREDEQPQARKQGLRRVGEGFSRGGWFAQRQGRVRRSAGHRGRAEWFGTRWAARTIET